MDLDIPLLLTKKMHSPAIVKELNYGILLIKWRRGQEGQ